MRAPLSWIRELVDLPDEVGVAGLTDRLTMLGLKLESVEVPAEQVTGPLVVGRVLSATPEPQKNGKTILWCTVDVGPELNAAHGTDEDAGVGIVCGASNFAAGDLVVTVLPGAVLPGGFEISARKTYGHVSTGMICSARELGLGEDHEGIVVLPADAGEPGQDARPVLGMDDPVIELEINPDRAYALSLRGIAREAALGYGVEFRDPAQRDVPAADGEGYPVVVDDPTGCPVFVARTVTGFDATAPTPEWMARRLTQAGMRPVSLGVDITNYVMLELGQPLHAYDRTRLQGPIRVRRAAEGERLTTLDGVSRTLAAEDLLITDDSGAIGIAGTMGGESTELGPGSSEVVVEAAHFDPVSVFHTRRRHRLGSEASRRFERGVDPELPAVAADRVVALMCTLGGATAEPGTTQVGAAPGRRTVTLSADLPARVTGMEIDAARTDAALAAVGCDVSHDGGDRHAVVPSWRPDLTDPYDLVEEVARVVGYDQVPAVLPPAPAGRGLPLGQRLRRRVATALAGAGLVETISYPFVGERDWERLGLPADDERRRTLRVANPLSTEEPFLSTTLLPGLLGSLARNVARGQQDLALFETGLVFRPDGTERAPLPSVERRPSDAEWQAVQDGVPDQPWHLALGLSGQREASGWWGPGRDATWADAVGLVREVAGLLDVPVAVRATTTMPWHPGRCAAVVTDDGTVVGHAGELHPRVCAAWDVPARTAVAEIDLDALVARVPDGARRAPRLSSYPVAKEDVALEVPVEVPQEQVEAALREGAGELLESVRLFDVYTGDQVADGRKSLAYNLRFRAPDRTLAEGEAAAARDAAVRAAAAAVGAVQR